MELYKSNPIWCRGWNAHLVCNLKSNSIGWNCGCGGYVCLRLGRDTQISVLSGRSVPTSDIQSVGSSVSGYRVQESLSQLGQRVRFGQSVRWSVKVATQHSKVQVTLRRHAEDWAVRAVSLIHRENGCENSLRRAEGFLAQPLAYLPRRNRGRVHLHKHCTHPNFPLLEQSLPSLRPAWDSTHAARQTTLECVDGGSHEGQT